MSIANVSEPTRRAIVAFHRLIMAELTVNQKQADLDELDGYVPDEDREEFEKLKANISKNLGRDTG